MLPIALGLGAATCIGFSNIVAGITARRLTPLIVGFWSQATGVVWCALLLLVPRPPLLSGQIAGGLIAGLAGGTGMLLFYRSMAAGAISLVAPITACSVVFPVIYAIASGETPTLPVAAGSRGASSAGSCWRRCSQRRFAAIRLIRGSRRTGERLHWPSGPRWRLARFSSSSILCQRPLAGGRCGRPARCASAGSACKLRWRCSARAG